MFIRIKWKDGKSEVRKGCMFANDPCLEKLGYGKEKCVTQTGKQFGACESKDYGDSEVEMCGCKGDLCNKEDITEGKGLGAGLYKNTASSLKSKGFALALASTAVTVAASTRF